MVMKSSSTTSKNLLRPYSIVLILFTLLTIGLTWPVSAQLFIGVAGFDGRDSFQHVWYQWWMKETLLELGVWPNQISHLYYPQGASHPVLALHPFVPLFFLPITLLSGPLVSYNVAFLATFVLSGLTGYLLCRYLTGNVWAGIIGGLIFAFHPNRFGHAAAGHLLLTTNYLLPLYALSLLILLRRPSMKMAVWHGIVTGLLALAQPTHIGYGIIPIFLVIVIAELFIPNIGSGQKNSPLWGARGAWLLISLVLALLIFFPFAWPTLAESQQGNLDYLTPDNLTEHATDLLAFVLPSPFNPILSSLGLVPAFGETIIDGFRDLEEQLAYPGLIAFGLMGVAVWQRWREARRWLILALGSALLSLGPLLKIAGEVTPIWLPYQALLQLPFFSWSRTPGRLNMTVMLGVAVLAAFGAAWLFQQLKASRSTSSIVLTAGLSILIIAEYLVIFPFPTEIRSSSSYYHTTLAQQPFDGGLLSLPATGSRRASNYAMFDQTVHGWPLAGGYIERDPIGTVELKEFLNQLVAPIPSQSVMQVPDEAQRRAILADLGITQITVNSDRMTDQAAKATLAYLPDLLGETVYNDEQIWVYKLADHSFAGTHLLPEQENWEVLRDGQLFRMKKEGFLFIYTLDPNSINLFFRVDDIQPTNLSLSINETNHQDHFLESSTEFSLEIPNLQPGFNYITLSTDPPQDIDFSEIALR